MNPILFALAAGFIAGALLGLWVGVLTSDWWQHRTLMRDKR